MGATRTMNGCTGQQGAAVVLNPVIGVVGGTENGEIGVRMLMRVLVLG